MQNEDCLLTSWFLCFSFPSRIHTGDRPYKCSHPGCEKSFTQLSNLQVNKSRRCDAGCSPDCDFRSVRSVTIQNLVSKFCMNSCRICHFLCCASKKQNEHLHNNRNVHPKAFQLQIQKVLHIEQMKWIDRTVATCVALVSEQFAVQIGVKYNQCYRLEWYCMWIFFL